ncbi:tail fiber domain-containing protein [Segatella oris]|uniref:tail fiber domain-containing protein n=1 Tax=Segatella oris TaxID=28135 RepID=UPI00037F3FF3|nr:tail fiber domain-containing protein [Segatella oris]
MIDIKMFARKRAEGTGRGGSTTPWTQSDDVRHALSADKATFAEQADKALQANDAARAAYADKARALAEDSPAYDEFLRKDKEDTAKELINFLKGVTIGDIKISYDEKNGALSLTRVSDTRKAAGLYATGGLTAFGAGTAQGGGSESGGTSYERLDRWNDYTTAKAAAVLSAFLGNDLNERLKRVEAGALTSVDWSIIKNKPTSMPASDVPAWAKAATKPSYAWSEITGKPSAFNPSAHSHSFASLTQKPTTLQGYGITDAASISHTHAFSALTNKPTTVDGYGIVDTFKTHREVNFAPDEAGYYAVMTTKSGIGDDWRHIISMDWSKNDSVNWISQLALPTQRNESVYYRKNEADGKQIKDAKWIKIWDEKNLTKLSQLTDDVVSGKYLSLAGGTLNGNLNILDNKLYAWNISGENSAFNFSHAIRLGHQNYNRCKFFEYGGVFEFYKSDDVQNNDESGAKLLGKITEKGWEGNASTADTINVKGQQNRPLKGTEMPPPGLNVYNIYENGYPFAYGNLLSIKGYGGSELAMQWQANSDVGRMLYRSKRDVGGWSDWATIAYLTDNVASATKLQNMRTLWGQNFDGTGDIIGALGSVTGINNILYFAGNNVGIGTNAPICKLDVNGSARVMEDLSIGGYLNLSNNKGLQLRLKDGTARRALFVSDSNVVYVGSADFPLYTLFEGSELQFNVYNNGWQNALILSRDKNATFYGNVLAQGGVTAYTTSDRRSKENIKAVDSMKIIRSLGGTWQFDYKDTGKHGIGFIAQSVRESMLKSMVYASDDGYLKLNYLDTRLIALALGAAVQVDDKVERLKKRIKVLETEIEQLKGGEK